MITRPSKALAPRSKATDFGLPGARPRAQQLGETPALPGLTSGSWVGRSVACAIVGMVLLLGCSRGRPGIEIGKVEGRVTFEGGPMPAGGRLLFLPRAAAADAGSARPSRPASATFATDGRFQATSWEPGDGLVPGTYAVVVECWQTPPTMGGPPAVSHVPEAYRSAETTPLKLEVPGDGKPVRADLEIW